MLASFYNDSGGDKKNPEVVEEENGYGNNTDKIE
jgi:hypothetical protein